MALAEAEEAEVKAKTEAEVFLPLLAWALALEVAEVPEIVTKVAEAEATLPLAVALVPCFGRIIYSKKT